MRITARIFCAALAVAASALTSASEFKTVNNNTFWKTVDGDTIYSQGGGIFRFPDPETGRKHYYWYGARYREAVKYAKAPVTASYSNSTHFEAVTCYRSDNLSDWTYVGDLVDEKTFDGILRPAWVGRLGVAYIPEAGLYAMLMQTEYSDSTPGYHKRVGVYTSPTPTGRFELHNLIDMTEMTGQPNTGDQTVFTDSDGKSYLCYSYGRGRNRIYISRIGVGEDGKIGLTDCKQVFKGAGREGNCMFRYKDRYYICASDLYGWNASNLYYLEADSVYGPYTPVNEMKMMPGAEMDYGHVTQTGFFVVLPGSREETVINCGDRWAGFAGNGNGFNQWCPITFDEGSPRFHSLSQWSYNHDTGEWKVGPENNYVKNFSFEADRNSIPSPVKPVQTYIKGWSFEVTEGNEIKTASEDSPVLNVKNSPDDRETVMGNYSLNFSDKADFARRVCQKIGSTDRVPLRDGLYRLTCKAAGGEGFSEFAMYVRSGDKELKADIPASDTWTTITIDNIPIHGGEAEVGFRASAKAGSQARVDDVVLTRIE